MLILLHRWQRLNIDFPQLKLPRFFELLENTHAHEMVVNLNRNSPLGVVDIRKVTELPSDFSYCLQHLLVLELVVVPTFEV